jgi:predicted DCC family thiol-disulfide oxidoreductase YuxK
VILVEGAIQIFVALLMIMMDDLMPTEITFPLTIYYDASCALCRTEMEALKAADKHDDLVLVDCSTSRMEPPASCPVTREALMSRIHAQDATGQWVTGVDVFAAAYTVTGYQSLAKFWSSRRLRPLLSRIYPLVADNRWWLSKTLLPKCMHFLLRKLAPK